METMIYLAPIVGVLALLFAFTLSNNIKKQDAGNQRMQEIASYIHEGAQAFLMAEYRILIIFVALLFFILGFALKSWSTSCAFLFCCRLFWHAGCHKSKRPHCRSRKRIRYA